MWGQREFDEELYIHVSVRETPVEGRCRTRAAGPNYSGSQCRLRLQLTIRNAKEALRTLQVLDITRKNGIL